MSAKIDMVGKRFNLLTVTAEEGLRRKEVAWRCSCECGGSTVVGGYALRSGATKSCGCLDSSDAKRRRNTRHGLADTRIHRSWMSMLGRCERVTDTAYANYGGRGIKVCERWHVFENFAHDMGPMPNRYTLDRIDVNGNYEPGNCRWASYSEQSKNTRRNRYLEFQGQRKTLSDWADELGVGRTTLAARLKAGWTVERALSLPTLSPHEAAAVAHQSRWSEGR